MGEFISIPTYTDKTIDFELMQLLGGKRPEFNNLNVRYLLFTVPGSPSCVYDRSVIINPVHAVVFVADSRSRCLQANKDSLDELYYNVSQQGIQLSEFPLVIQYNKRDHPDALPVHDLQEKLNPWNTRYVETIATQGIGVLETLKAILKLAVKRRLFLFHQEDEYERWYK